MYNKRPNASGADGHPHDHRLREISQAIHDHNFGLKVD